ncbi:hypothetical protein PPSIR1_37134 [Plesiocystis pacifica SIR-1]|uniref:NADP-dependent oxidoreductase domain-containing protein n=1 Tax=Plesiocystis pacifica SIR-1 TaxID=391625 RepID=A6G0J2_9BACT|nr:aldo/keto reductase [Plesiocystis pacifica]EDM80638.1 hypothetical protein PPSIR1_37134 [Plesiocystis pacifica SIR-1]
MSRRSPIERGCGDALIDLLDPDPVLRRYAVDAVPLDTTGLYALRERLLDDRHGPVRAAAAERLARAARASFDDAGERRPTRAEANRWIVEALGDPLLSVRVIACRVALRHAGRDAALEARLRQMVTQDPAWRVRRAAARALAGVSGPDAIPGLIAGLDDPFWRVRHGVVQALGFVVSRNPEDQRGALRSRILEAGRDLDEAPRAALRYLALEWAGEEAALGDPELGEQRSRLAQLLGTIPDPGAGLELSDPDPAVVTARLQACERAGAPELEPAALIPLLAESHVPLRDEAARRLAQLDDPRALLPALAWLEDPRVPNAPGEVRRLLGRLGHRARPLVLAVLELDDDRVVALGWACSWIAAHPAEDLHGRVLELSAHRHPQVRAAAIACLGQVVRRERATSETSKSLREAVRRALRDPSDLVRDAAALAVYGPGTATFPELEPPPLEPATFAQLGATVRARLVAAGLPEACLEVALEDPDARVRALAHASRDAGAHQPDPDPWVRAVQLDLASAQALFEAEVETEADPGVRRGAARLLVRHRETLALERVVALAPRLFADADPWIRARASELVDARAAESEALLSLLLRATRDGAAMVRLSATASLDRTPGLDAALDALLTRSSDEDLRIAAWSRRVSTALSATDSSVPEAVLARIRDAPSEGPRVAAHLDELAVALGAEPSASALESAAQARVELSHAPVEPRPRPHLGPGVTRRPLGRTGIELAPLVVSGAFAPTPSSLAHAVERGVDTLFWEPRYASATRFLRQPRRRDVQVIAGSFHADPASIVADLETALRRLSRDHIDLFLLYWVRSPARLSPAARDCLRALQAQGKIRSFGFSTHDRAIACAAVETGDWPVIMTRHSAAHTGAELELFPAAAAAGVGLLAFSCLCYGRMLRPSSVFPSGPAALDCYRYSLGQPGVSACISAPQRHRQLAQNLELLQAPPLGGLELEALRAHGREIYADNKRFDRLLRRGGAGPLREALLELFERNRVDTADDAAVEQRDD